MSRLNLNGESMGKFCVRCQKRIPASSKYDKCKECFKHEIFPSVREYVEQNDVSEVELAEHFELDLSIVKEWIRDGSLEQKKG